MQSVNVEQLIPAPSTTASDRDTADAVQLPDDLKVKLKKPLPREAVSANPQARP